MSASRLLLGFFLGVACFLALPALPARAQDEAIDADYRLHDVIYVKNLPDPLTGTIVEGSEAGSPKLVVRLLSGITHELVRDDVIRILPRETPESAYRQRARKLGEAGDPALHRRLAEWCHDLGLAQQAEAQLRLATKTASDPEQAREHRERLVELQETRCGELDGAARDTLLEQILAAGGGGEPSPRLGLAHARVARRLDLLETAYPLLQTAREKLDDKAQNGEPVDQLPLDAGGEAGEGDGGEGDGEGGEGAGDDPGDGDGGDGDGQDAGEGSAEEPGNDDPRPRRPRPGFGRDGEGMDPKPQDAEDPLDAIEAPAPDDHSIEQLPGLTYSERELWRSVLLELGEVSVQVGRLNEARETFARVLEVWPQHESATLRLAEVLASLGQRAPAIAQLDAALVCAPTSVELLLARGQQHYLAGHDALATNDLQTAATVLAAAAEPVAPAGGDEDPVEVEPALPGVTELARTVHVSLALAHIRAGRFEKAKPALDAADAAPGYGPARLTKGLLAELEGELGQAQVHYDEAERLLAPHSGEVGYSRSFALVKDGNHAGAEAALEDALRRGYDFGLVFGALINLAAQRSESPEEARLAELLYRSRPDPAVDRIASLGRVYLAAGRHEDAARLFARGLELEPDHLPCLRGQAYCAYADDDYERAHSLFTRILLEAKDDVWAQQGLKNLDEARTRRVWTDAFDREGPEVLNSWTIAAAHGVEVLLDGGELRFRGLQKNEAEGKTRCARSVSGESVVKFEATLRPSALNAGRVGIRFESDRQQFILYRDTDGQVKYSSTRGGKNPWQDPIAVGSWPSGGGGHTLAIDVEDLKAGRVAFLVNGERRGEVKVGSMRSRRSYELVLYGQGVQLEDLVEFAVEEARIYVLRADKKR